MRTQADRTEPLRPVALDIVASTPRIKVGIRSVGLRLNDRPGYQHRLRGDEAGAKRRREGLAERPGGGNLVPVQRHAGRAAVGIRALPADKRKNMLDRALADLLGLFKDRVLPFDSDAARHYADLAVKARNGGRGFPTPDGYIAAVAAARGFIAESRDTSPYEAAGVALINPWKDA